MKTAEIIRIVEDEMSKTPIIILHIEENNTFLQICVGAFEGNALELGLNNNQLLRPLPYDTFISIINKLGGRVEAVVIRKVINNRGSKE